MARGRLGWLIALVLALLVLAPVAAAQTSGSAASHPLAKPLPPPQLGVVVNCTSRITCAYLFNDSRGTGWASSTVSYSSGLAMALQLPGEAVGSTNLSYSTYIARLTGTYTYWTVGNFFGTDVNSGTVVYGTTNTNYTITCHGHSGRGGGCTYTYTTDNGTISVQSTKAEITTTSISCSPTSTSPGRKVTCSVTVANGWNASKYPVGKVHISSGLTGVVSNKGVCTLVNGSCAFTYRPFDNTCGTVELTATYGGNSNFYRSSASLPLSVVVSGGC